MSGKSSGVIREPSRLFSTLIRCSVVPLFRLSLQGFDHVSFTPFHSSSTASLAPTFLVSLVHSSIHPFLPSPALTCPRMRIRASTYASSTLCLHSILNHSLPRCHPSSTFPYIYSQSISYSCLLSFLFFLPSGLPISIDSFTQTEASTPPAVHSLSHWFA